MSRSTIIIVACGFFFALVAALALTAWVLYACPERHAGWQAALSRDLLSSDSPPSSPAGRGVFSREDMACAVRRDDSRGELHPSVTPPSFSRFSHCRT